MRDHGFFCVINHGYTPEQTARIFDIADVPFSQVSEADKKVYEATIQKTGSYQGFKLRKYWHIENGVRDEVEHYNINHDVTRREHPEALRPFIPEIKEFARHNHEDILHPILRLLAIGLELPEDTLVKFHNHSAVGETDVRFMKYYPRSKEDELKSKNVWLKGHTDFGSITILYSQPVAGLQILTRNGTWKWVKHIENALVINAGDALQLLSGGYYQATIHRVIQPPPDQRQYGRLGVFYFSMPDDNVTLAPLVESPVLQRAGLMKLADGVKPPTMVAWRQERTRTYGQIELKAAGNGVEEEIIQGVVVKHYN
ncbi:Clavaminate synthase-like protein [Pholiota conissans]|uniref:Clavaminate synthase-like protein n=1 Tax=Pholiota conissans TaxID=109636 RepID=A0A9P5ZI28_9AGAR|nr:Clavaminate synthase-like protein [Pholiota conissans]